MALMRAAAPARPPVNKWLVTVSITFGTLMGTIDASIVNVAVPHLSGSLGATVEQITWVSTGFALANVIVMPLTAFLGRLFGQKRVYMFCLALFLVGFVLCGMARSLEMLVAWSCSTTATYVAAPNSFLVAVCRGFHSGINPEIEVGRFLTEVAGFANTPALFGSVEL